MLKKTTDFYNFADLLLASHMNLSQAIGFAREAQQLDITLDERKDLIDKAKQEINCLAAHFEGALDCLPLEEEPQSECS